MPETKYEPDRVQLARTRAAIEAYDRRDLSKGWEAAEGLGRAVGVAYGLDTCDINDPETCAALIRPGPRVPGPGQQLSFVRRMVRQAEKEGDRV